MFFIILIGIFIGRGENKMRVHIEGLVLVVVNRPAKHVFSDCRSFGSIKLLHVKAFIVCDLTVCLRIIFMLSLVSTEEIAKDHSLEYSLFFIHLVVTVLLILRTIHVIFFLLTRSVNITHFSEKVLVKRG